MMMAEFTNGKSWTVETDIQISDNLKNATYVYRVIDDKGNIVGQGSTVNPIVDNGIEGTVYVNVNRKQATSPNLKQITHDDMFETILIAVGAGFVGGICAYVITTYFMDKLR